MALRGEFIFPGTRPFLLFVNWQGGGGGGWTGLLGGELAVSLPIGSGKRHGVRSLTRSRHEQGRGVAELRQESRRQFFHDGGKAFIFD